MPGHNKMDRFETRLASANGPDGLVGNDDVLIRGDALLYALQLRVQHLVHLRIRPGRSAKLIHHLYLQGKRNKCEHVCTHAWGLEIQGRAQQAASSQLTFVNAILAPFYTYTNVQLRKMMGALSPLSSWPGTMVLYYQ